MELTSTQSSRATMTHRHVKNNINICCRKPLRFWSCLSRSKSWLIQETISKHSQLNCHFQCLAFTWMREIMFSLQYHFKITFNTSMMKKVFVLVKSGCKSSRSLLPILSCIPFLPFFFLIFGQFPFIGERKKTCPEDSPPNLPKTC